MVTVDVLVLVDVDVELLVVLTVDVLVDVLLVSTRLFESYTVCAVAPNAAVMHTAAMVFLNMAPILIIITPTVHGPRLCIYRIKGQNSVGLFF